MKHSNQNFERKPATRDSSQSLLRVASVAARGHIDAGVSGQHERNSGTTSGRDNTQCNAA